MHSSRFLVALVLSTLAAAALAQPGNLGQRDRAGGPPGGPGGPGGPNREDVALVEEHDRDGDGWLNADERAAARAALEGRRDSSPPQRRFGRENRASEPPTPGPEIEPSEVEVFGEAGLYDSDTFRTIFLTFESEDWEAELEAFHGTDVEVPADMVVDGARYEGVGVRFRGASSYMRVPAGYKRSFNVSLDLTDEDQRLYGYKTLNLLNCNGDDSMMSTVLYAQMAGQHIAVPRANFVRVVVNGEYWGVYVSVQQFDKVFTAEHFGSSKGTRWKVPGSPRGDGGLAYLGEDLGPYRERYDMKSDDGEKAWERLVELCRVLNETPLDRLEEALDPILDIDGALWFLAYDVALINSDGYWTRASDYSLFEDSEGRFHLIPHDMNEAFREARRGGPGGRPGAGRIGRPGPGVQAQTGADGYALDPLVGVDEDRLALRSRLLAVPELRERYLGYIDRIAREDLDWQRLGPRIAEYRTLIADAVRQDTRKLGSYEAFLAATSSSAIPGQTEGSLERFARARRDFLLGQGSGED